MAVASVDSASAAAAAHNTAAVAVHRNTRHFPTAVVGSRILAAEGEGSILSRQREVDTLVVGIVVVAAKDVRRISW